MGGRYFGTDGIRGRANRPPITPDIAMKVGMAAGIVFRNGEHRHEREVDRGDSDEQNTQREVDRVVGQARARQPHGSTEDEQHEDPQDRRAHSPDRRACGLEGHRAMLGLDRGVPLGEPLP